MDVKIQLFQDQQTSWWDPHHGRRIYDQLRRYPPPAKNHIHDWRIRLQLGGKGLRHADQAVWQDCLSVRLHGSRRTTAHGTHLDLGRCVYVGVGISIWPFLSKYKVTFISVAASTRSLTWTTTELDLLKPSNLLQIWKLL